MAAWIADGPVSLPPRGLTYAAALAIVLMGAAGVGLGFQAAQRQAGAPDARADSSAAADDTTMTAKPIVELPAPVTAPEPDQAAKDAADDAATDQAVANNSISAKSAAAQAVQSDTAKPAGDIDEILTSKTEKPPPAVKPPADEAPPPVKSDVPF